MSSRSRFPVHRSARGARRMAALMLVVQLLLLLFTALPLSAPAAASRASSEDPGLWVMVCSPQGMKLVPLQTLTATATDSAPDPAQPADLPRDSHCLLCQQQHSPALPALALPPLPLAIAAAAPAPQWRPAAPHCAAPVWRPLLARAPPRQG